MGNEEFFRFEESLVCVLGYWERNILIDRGFFVGLGFGYRIVYG